MARSTETFDTESAAVRRAASILARVAALATVSCAGLSRSDPPESVLVRGQLVLVGGGVPRNGVVSLRTGDRAVDFADLWRALGGVEAVDAMHPLALERRIEELGGWHRAYTARADEEGRFALPVPRGTDTFELDAEADGAVKLARRRYTLESMEVADGLVLPLELAATLEGVVRDPEGRPIAGARVFLGATILFMSPGDETRSTKTDDRGRYRFENVRPFSGFWSTHKARLCAYADGYGPASWGPESLAQGETQERDLRLPLRS